MLIELNDDVAPALSPDELVLEFAVWLYQTGKLTKAQARRLTPYDRVAFEQVLLERGAGPELTRAHYQQDLDALQRP